VLSFPLLAALLAALLKALLRLFFARFAFMQALLRLYSGVALLAALHFPSQKKQLYSRLCYGSIARFEKKLLY
jgi:hypothetical protein